MQLLSLLQLSLSVALIIETHVFHIALIICGSVQKNIIKFSHINSFHDFNAKKLILRFGRPSSMIADRR